MKEKTLIMLQSIRYYKGQLSEKVMALIFNIDFYTKEKRKPRMMSPQMHSRFKKYACRVKNENSRELH